MPWTVCDAMSERREFVALAGAEGANVSELCRRFSISRRVGYKWLGRYEAEGESGLAERSRRPRRSPQPPPEAMEAKVLELRQAHPAWGGRKLRRRLSDLGQEAVPAASTITEILRRHGRLDEAESASHKPFTRFERAAPNDLWQMDFKGHFAIEQGRCHPLTVLDDHSRYALELAVPASRYAASPRAFPEVLAPIEYAPELAVRKVRDKGELSYQGRTFKLPKAFKGYPVALRPTVHDGELDVLFCQHVIARLNPRVPETNSRASLNGRRQREGASVLSREPDELTTLGVTHVPAHL